MSNQKMTQEELDQYLETWSKQTGLPKTQLAERIEQVIEEADKKGEGISILFALKQVRRQLRSEFGKAAKEVPEFEGFFVGLAPLTDWMERRRGKALRAFKANPQKALMQGLVDEAGTPLDTRQKVFGRDNPRFGKPLDADPAHPTHEYEISAYGFFRMVGIDDTWKFCQFSVRNEAAKDFIVPLYKPVKFRAKLWSNEKKTILNLTEATRFAPTKIPEDILSIIGKQAALLPLGQLGTFYQDHKDTFLRLAFVEGEVGTLQELTNYTRLTLTTTDLELDLDTEDVTCFVPTSVLPDIKPGDAVLVFGQVGTDRRGEGLVVSAYGVYPTRVAPEASEATSLAEDEIYWNQQ